MFYKTDDTQAVAAYLQFTINQKALMEKAKQFGDIYGGEPMFSRVITTVRFSGLKFDKPMNNDIWCLPDPKRGGIRTLRARALKPEHQAELKRLKADWKKNYETIFKDQVEVSHKDFLSSVGTSWGKLYFHSFDYFLWDGFVYIKTDVELATHCTEILGSEFKAAEAAQTAAPADSRGLASQVRKKLDIKQVKDTFNMKFRRYRQVNNYEFEMALIACVSSNDATTYQIQQSMLREKQIQASMAQVREHLNRLAYGRLVVKSEKSTRNLAYWRLLVATSGQFDPNNIAVVEKIKCQRCRWIGTWGGTVNKPGKHGMTDKVCPGCECRTFTEHKALELMP